MNFTGSTSTEPVMFKNFCIGDYVAEVRRKDWSKCCPFNLWDGSEEYDREAEMVYFSLFPKEEEDLVNTQGGIIPPSSDWNLSGLKSQQCRMLLDVYQELGGSSYDEENEISDSMTLNTSIREIEGKGVESRVRKGKVMKKPFSSNEDSEFSTESDNDLDEFTLTTLKKNKRAVQHTSKRRRASKGKKKTPPVEENTSRICELFSKNTETSKESFLTSEDDVKAAEALLCMSHVEVQTNSLSKTAIEEQAQSKAKDKG